MPAVGTEKVGPTMSRVPKFGANDDECGDPNQEYIMEPHAAQPILLEHDEGFTCFLIVQRWGRIRKFRRVRQCHIILDEV